MAEPITLSLAAAAVAEFCGHVALHVGYHEGHHFYREFIERWQDSPIDPATDLPRNHDLQEGSRKALREAAQVLVIELAGQLEPSKPWMRRLRCCSRSLPPAQEAVDLRRTLAHQNPEAFLPDLARSLGTLGQVHSGMGRHVETAEALSEGILSLQSHFTRAPKMFAPLMGLLVRAYLEASRAAGSEPDATLFTAISTILEQLAGAERKST